MGRQHTGSGRGPQGLGVWGELQASWCDFQQGIEALSVPVSGPPRHSKQKKWPGMVAHACNPSTGLALLSLRLRLPEHPTTGGAPPPTGPALGSHPEGLPAQGPHHRHEEWLLQQGNHGADE